MRLSPLQMPVSSHGLSPVLLTNRLQIRGSQDLLLSFNNFLEQLTELVENTLPTRLPAYCRGHNSGTARWGRVCEEAFGASTPSLGGPPSPHLPMYVHQPDAFRILLFRGFYASFIMWAWWIKSLAIGD